MASIVVPSALLLGTLLLVPQVLGDFTAYQIGLFLIYGIAAQGIGFLWGKTGILPLGQTVFFGCAAYTSAHILMRVDGLGFQLVLIVGAILLIGATAFVLASLVFRGRSDSGPYFSLITLALVMIVEQLAGTTPDLTGGFNGLSGFEPVAGLDPYGNLYYLIAGVAVCATVLLLVLDRLPAGLIAKAVADNEPRLQLLGFPTHIVKGLAFALSAILAAVAGVLFASHQGIVTPTSTGFALSAQLVIWTAVGGRFHVLGPLFGAVLIGWLTAELRDDFKYWEITIAILFIVVVLKAPGGLSEMFSPMIRKLRFLRRSEPVSPSFPAPEVHINRKPGKLVFSDCFLQVGVVKILNGVTFETPAKGILCVIGPNGAGKTSMLNVITGNLATTSGQIELAGQRIHGRPPHAALASGIGRKLQVPSVFFSMSVAENLTIALLAGRARLWDFFCIKPMHWQSDYLRNLLAHPSVPLRNELQKPVGELPQGHRQFLEFAMTTAAEPRLLLLDEPCAGLSPDETGLMTNLVREYQAETDGLVIVIEHDMSIVESISEKVLVLHQGKVLAFDDYATVKANEAVAAVYAGGTK
jgi:branched-chain amino acid transport system permease protein